MQAFLLIVLLAIASVASAFNVTQGQPTVPTLDIPKYLGLWYQMYADAVVYASFEKDSYCSTALYGDNGDGTISVHNYATVGAPNGSKYTIDGYAYQRDATQPGKLMVHFDSSDAFPFDAPYWVLALGPIVNDQYDWAIVSDNLSMFLFVLARDVKTFKSQYETTVLQQLDAMGFKGTTKPIATYQGDDCVYEAVLRKKQIMETAQKAAAAQK